MRKLDLKDSLSGRRPFAKNIEDETASIDDLAVPSALEITLLYGADKRVQYHERRIHRYELFAELHDLSLTEQCRRPAPPKLENAFVYDEEIDRPGKPNCLG